MNQSLIVSDPAVMMGRTVIAGTRITVELILEKLGAGETPNQLLEAHPHLTQDAILAALEFAARALRADVTYTLSWQIPMNLGVRYGLVWKPACSKWRSTVNAEAIPSRSITTKEMQSVSEYRLS